MTLLFALLIIWDELLPWILFTNESRPQALNAAISNPANGQVSDYGMLANSWLQAQRGMCCQYWTIGVSFLRLADVRPRRLHEVLLKSVAEAPATNLSPP
jgi:hypothetical protein